MPLREKNAWLQLAAILTAYIPYFLWSQLHGLPAMPGLGQLWRFAIAAAVHALIVIMGMIVLAARTPAEAKMPADERDRAIELGGLKWAYYVLIIGMILVGVVGPFQHSGWVLVQGALFMIVLAEVVHYVVAVIAYRRQAA